METDLFQKRRAGILLHPTSLPGPYGIGSFGRWAYRWIDRLHESGVGIWQVLPLGPTGFGDSPYQCYSAFAGNPLLIDLPLLEEEGFICENLHGSRDDFEEERVDFERVRAYKLPLLFQAYRTMRRNGLLREAFETFCAKESHWLDDYALFMALKERHGGRAWQSWEPALARRDPDALKAFASAHTEAVDRWRFWQFLFERQWQNLRSYARLKGVEIVGDMPIYVAEDSSDVWAASHLFELDDHGYPRRVAGVPPDAFSATGQCWGNPLYAWDAMAKEGYAWWRRRMARALSLYDHVRIDHFRGFESYWAIPAEAETAADGEWVKGPGKAFFDRLGEDLGPMPLIAEDLGIITDEVTRLRESLRMPGMKILQFAFEGDADNPYLPHNYTDRCVVYTGTHDNDTTAGWYDSLDEAVQKKVCRYLDCSEERVVGTMMRAALASVAKWAVLPMQDLLELGSEARMNQPGEATGNWRWRMTSNDLIDADWPTLNEMIRLYGRSKKI